MDLTLYPTALLYSLLGLLTAGVGVTVLVFQTGATRQALTARRSMLVGGVLLVLIGALVLGFQIWAIATDSYGTAGTYVG